MKCIRVQQKSADISALALSIDTQPVPTIDTTDCLIEIESAGVNPSDVKAVLGFMPHAVWPRTPGRDYAGRVIDGPPELVGVGHGSALEDSTRAARGGRGRRKGGAGED